MIPFGRDSGCSLSDREGRGARRRSQRRIQVYLRANPRTERRSNDVRLSQPTMGTFISIALSMIDARRWTILPMVPLPSIRYPRTFLPSRISIAVIPAGRWCRIGTVIRKVLRRS